MASSFRELIPYSLLLLASVIGVVQCCFILTFGQTVEGIASYYNLSEEEGHVLYSAMNFGACAMCFLAGLLFDHLGPLNCCMVATVAGVLPPLLQLHWGSDVPELPTTMTTLVFCYMIFGFGAATFNVIGCFAPLAGFSEANIGKANTLVQVSISLGISYQSWAYDQAKGDDTTGAFFPTYLQYAAIFTALSGLFSYLGLYAFCATVATPPKAKAAHGSTPVMTQILSTHFAWMTLLFAGCVGFSFSFLDYEAKIAEAVGSNVSPLLKVFGVLDAVGRVAVNSPLDYTRKYWFGGPVAYISTSLLVFASGLLMLVLPEAPGLYQLQLANGLIALGYGGMMGMVTAALRLQFGTEHMGVLCGVLYIVVSGAQPAWGMLTKPLGCAGVGCYRQYCAAGAATMVAIATLGFLLLLRTPHPKRLAIPDAKKEPLLDLEAELCN